MNEFSWLPLRLNILPLIHKQAHWLHARFLRTRTQILEGDILALQTLLTLRERVPSLLSRLGTASSTSNSSTPPTSEISALLTFTQCGLSCNRYWRAVRSSISSTWSRRRKAAWSLSKTESRRTKGSNAVLPSLPNPPGAEQSPPKT